MAIFLCLLLLFIATAFGRMVLRRCLPCVIGESLANVYGGAIGLGVAAYAVLLVGLVGELKIGVVGAIWALMFAASFKDASAIAKSLCGSVALLPGWWRRVSEGDKAARYAALGAGACLLFGAASILACYKPPGGVEWDAISYHLADPKQFILAGRISSLPTEHHSNFPLLMEMLYTVGLMLNGYALANMMHLATAALTTLAIFTFTRGRLGAAFAWLASVLFISTPVVLWESSVAYIELGLGLYITLAVMAAICAIDAEDPKDRSSWLVLAGTMAGLSLGVKYLALIPSFLILVLLATRLRPVSQIVRFLAVLAIVASPWYVRNIVNTHNPVYPFYYKLFPGSVNWSANRAAAYQSEQAHFGTVHTLSQPGPAIRNLLQVPWDLVTLPNTDTGTYSNKGEFSYLTLVGGLCFAFLPTLLLTPGIKNRGLSQLTLLAVAQVAAWFFVAQVSRYLVSTLPLLSIAAAWGSASARACVRKHGDSISGFAARGCLVGSVILALAQALGTLWSITSGPQILVPMSLPVVASILRADDGVDNYLKRYLDSYASTDWINHNSSPQDRILIYDDTRGFYLDRQYMWANEEHSAYIPYSTFADGKEMTDWFLRNGYRYAMINMNWAPQNSDHTHPDPAFPKGPNLNEQAALQAWYANVPLRPAKSAGFRWRGLVADAIKRGLWTDAGGSQHGVAVLKIDDPSIVTLLEGAHQESNRN